jgi:hypothetical protein
MPKKPDSLKKGFPMPTATIYGVPVEAVVLIVFFFIVVAMLLFGPNCLNDGVITTVIVFLTFGLTLIVGYFGWAILIIPSVIILLVAAVFIFRLFF